MKKFHDLIASIKPDHSYFGECVSAAKFDLGDADNVTGMAKVGNGEFCRPPVPLTLFQMLNDNGRQLVFTLVKEHESEERGKEWDGFLSFHVFLCDAISDRWCHPREIDVVYAKKAGDGGYGLYGNDGNGLPIEFSYDFDINTREGWIRSYVADLCFTFEVFSCANVVAIDHSPPKFINQQRVKKGKLPFYSYKTLHITGQSKEKSENTCGTHASPRLHLRRGHIRRYSDGKKVWVTAHLVGDKSKGFVGKDYEVRLS